MLETTAHLHHTVNVGTALMGKGCITHIGGVRVAGQVHNLVDAAAQLTKPCNLLGRKELGVHLEMQVCRNGGEVRISATFTKTVHHALYHQGTVLHSIKAVAHRKTGIIVNMDSKGR